MFQDGNVTVMVTDFERALGFYTEALGLKLKFRAENHWAEVCVGSFTIGLHPTREDCPAPTPGAQGPLSIGLQVADIEAAMATLTKRGVEFQGPVIDDGPVKLAMFSDPDGTPLYLCQQMQA